MLGERHVGEPKHSQMGQRGSKNETSDVAVNALPRLAHVLISSARAHTKMANFCSGRRRQQSATPAREEKGRKQKQVEKHVRGLHQGDNVLASGVKVSL